MGEVGGMLASVIGGQIKLVIQQLGSVIGGQIKLQWDFSKDLEKMKMTLESVEAVLMDAEKRSIEEAAVRLWLGRLKNAMYDISDMIDEFQTSSRVPTRKHCTQKYRTLVSMIRMSNKMKQMREKLKEITDQHQSFSLTIDLSSNENKVTDIRETSSNIGETVIVGRTREKKEIVSLLSEEMSQKITILPIYGIGGIGKTTFAKLIFNGTEFKDYLTVWVYVSQTYDLRKIGNSIISQLSGEESHISQIQMINISLAKLFSGKKILIVLDDLWEDDASQLDCLKGMLKLGESNSTIVIVTTRNESVAEKLFTIKPYKMEPLTHDMCWDIIKQKSCFETREDKDLMKKVGKEIAMKCGGVALAAQCLGYMLKSMRSDEWKSVKDSNIWNESTSFSHGVLVSLRLSYINMHPYMKLCFAYCGIFPKGHKIVKDDLIHQWVSLGYIKPENILSTKQLGERYITDLVGMCFLQQSEPPPVSGLQDQHVVLFTMHDLVHDLARSIIMDETLDESKKSKTVGCVYRFAVLTYSKKPELCMTSLARLKALRIMNSGQIGLHDVDFSSAKCLCVLDLSACAIQKLPDSIGKLKQLRYLNAPRIQNEMIPKSITRLGKLNYLKIQGSSTISKLPKSIGEMDCLVHLDLSGCSGIEELPKSFGELKRLVHLNFAKCSLVTGVSEFLGNFTELQYLNLSYCHKIGEAPRALGSLLQLQYLNLAYSSYVHGRSLTYVLGALTKLEYLNLSSANSDIKSALEALCNMTRLKHLYLRGCHEIEELPISLGKLKNLVQLDLSYCGRVNRILEVLSCLTKLQHLNLGYCSFTDGAKFNLKSIQEFMGNITELRYLNLSRCLETIFEYQICSFIECICSLSNLEYLNLSDNSNIRSLPESLCSLRKLHTLDLSSCIQLKSLPESICAMDNLRLIAVKGCNVHLKIPRLGKTSIVLPNFAVQSCDEKGSNLVQLQDVNISNELGINGLENVMYIQEAKAIKLMERQSITELRYEWTRDAKRFVEDMELLTELRPPRTLKCFVIGGYNSVSLPCWLMTISDYLIHLVEIEMMNMPKCKRLPPLGQLQNLKHLRIIGMDSILTIDESFCGGGRAFPQLEDIEIGRMECLEIWNTMYSYGENGVNEFMFPNLKLLMIYDCPRLRLKPHPPKAKNWTISNSDIVISSWEQGMSHTGVFSSFPLVAELSIMSCNLPLYQWKLLHHLPVLGSLTIMRCSNLSSSPEIIRDFSSLDSLSLNCSHLEVLPKWLGELKSLRQLSFGDYWDLEAPLKIFNKLTSLRSLHLCRCECMTTLPEWLGQLSSLQELSIWNWHQLNNLGGSIQHLASLVNLDISYCPKLNDFQESLQHLTSLLSLTLANCESILGLPECLGDLTALKGLEISKCVSIKSLPDSIHKLTSLVRLRIHCCPELEQWCELDENKKKLAHIERKRFYQ